MLEEATTAPPAFLNFGFEPKVRRRFGALLADILSTTFEGPDFVGQIEKAIDRSIRITDIRLIHKSGGKSGTYDAA